MAVNFADVAVQKVKSVASSLGKRIDPIATTISTPFSQIGAVLGKNILQGAQSFSNIGYSKFNPGIAATRAIAPQRTANIHLNQPTLRDVGNVTKAGLTGVGMITNPGFGLFSGGINTGFNAMGNIANKRPILSNTGQAFGEGYIGGSMMAPLIGASNPFLSKAISGFTAPVAGRVASSVANVAQGLGLDVATGKPLGSTAPLDALTGFAFGPGQFGGMKMDQGAILENPFAKKAGDILQEHDKTGKFSMGALEKARDILVELKLKPKEIAKMMRDQDGLYDYLKNALNENQSFAYHKLPGMKFADTQPKGVLTPEQQAAKDFQESWAKAYGNRPETVRSITELDKTNFTKHGKLPEGVTREEMLSVTQPKVGGVPEGGVKNQTQIEGKLPVQKSQTGNTPPLLPGTPQVDSGISQVNNNTRVPIGSASQYNVGKINTKNQKILERAIDEVKPSFEKLSGGGPMTHKEILAQSTEFSNKVIQEVGRQTTEQLGAAQLRLRRNIAQMADDGKVTPELIEAMRADASFARANAQLLGQRAIMADPKTPYGRNMVKYVTAVNKVADDIDLVVKKAEGVNFNDAEQAANFYRQFVKPSIGSWLDRVRYSSMLSSPNTTINNFSSNLQGTGILAPIEKTVSGGIDAIVSGITGSQRKHFAGEGIKYAEGYFSSLKPALNNFVEAMRGNSDASEMFNIPLTRKGTLGRKAENSLAFFPRLQQAVDEFFGALTTGGLEKANTYRVAKGGVAQSAEQIALESKRRLFNQPFGTDQSHMLNAIEYIPSKIMEATHSKNPFIKWTAKFAFPFVRIPTNVFKAGIEYSPLGIGTLPGAVNKTEQASKALMGTAVAMGAWSLASADRLTFGMPTSEKQRDAFTAAGMQPYSVKIGDKWIGYTKFHPIIGFNMALASAVKEQMDKQTVSDDEIDTVVGIASKWLTYFANQSYVKQMGDFMSLSKGNEVAVGQMLSNYPTQLIPFRALAGWVARAFDPNERKIDPDGSKLDKALQSIMMSIPGLRNQLPARTNSMGQPVPQQNRFLNLVSPGKVTQEVPEQKSQFDQMKAKSIQTGKDKAIKDQLTKSMSGTAVLDGGRIAYWDPESASTKELNVGEVASMPESNPYEKALKEKEAYAMAEKVLKLKPEEQAAVFSSLGISPEDAVYYNTAKQEVRLKSLHIDEEISKLDTSNRANLINYLISQRKEVNGNMVLTNTIVGELADKKIISDAEAAMLKNLKIVNGKPVTKLTGRGKKTALKRVSAPAAPLKIKSPSMKTLLAGKGKLKVKKYKFRRTL